MGISIENLARNRKGFLLENISFSLPEGYILGVIGRNGSGKSTFFETLLAGLCPDGGNVIIDQAYTAGQLGSMEETEEKREQRKIEFRKQISFVLEDCPFPEQLSAVDLMTFFGAMYQDFNKEYYLQLLEKLEVPTKKQIRRLSQGMRLKLQMAFAFSYSSKLLLLDEPSAHLDTFARKELYQLIYTYMENGNRNVIWATHLTDELDRMADYLLLLDNGKQLMFDMKDDILNQYTVVKGGKKQLDYMKSKLIGRIDRETFSEGLAKTEDGPFLLADEQELPTIEQLMCYLFDTKKR